MVRHVAARMEGASSSGAAGGAYLVHLVEAPPSPYHMTRVALPPIAPPSSPTQPSPAGTLHAVCRSSVMLGSLVGHIVLVKRSARQSGRWRRGVSPAGRVELDAALAGRCWRLGRRDGTPSTSSRRDRSRPLVMMQLIRHGSQRHDESSVHAWLHGDGVGLLVGDLQGGRWQWQRRWRQ